MSLLLLQAQQFRNFAELSLQPHPQFNLLVGENGSGKTSLLEAIYYLAHGRSFRTSDLKEMIRHGQPSTHVFAEIGIGDYLHRFGLARMRNGGFEESAQGAPLGWSLGGLLVADPTVPAEGSHCVKAWHDGRVVQTLRVTRGQPVTVRMKVRGEFLR